MRTVCGEMGLAGDYDIPYQNYTITILIDIVRQCRVVLAGNEIVLEAASRGTTMASRVYGKVEG